MKNFVLKLFLISITLLFTYTSHAEETKIITLKDGSTLKGEVLYLQDGTYTIKTSNLGEIQVHESDITGINSEHTARPNSQYKQSTSTMAGNSFQMQMEQLKGNIMADQNLMQEIMGILDNEEVMSIISDQNFINDIMSHNPEKLEGNEKLQKLLENPEIQTLINKIEQKTPSEQ